MYFSFSFFAETHAAVFAPKVQIEVPEFLTTFFKISAVAKGLASRRDATSRMREYRVALKVSLIVI